MGKQSQLSMKLKAAESMMLLPFAIHMCTVHAAMDGAAELRAAGEVLLRHVALLRWSPAALPIKVCQRLLDLSIHHLKLMAAAGVSNTPKQHLWIHRTLRSRELGNPRKY
eukprot:7878441-Pyramimonas_sp.AAC.1